MVAQVLDSRGTLNSDRYEIVSRNVLYVVVRCYHAVQYNTILYNAIQYHTTQYNTLQDKTTSLNNTNNTIQYTTHHFNLY